MADDGGMKFLGKKHKIIFLGISPKNIANTNKQYSDSPNSDEEKCNSKLTNSKISKKEEDHSQNSNTDKKAFYPIYSSIDEIDIKYNMLKFFDESNQKLELRRKNYFLILPEIDIRKRSLLIDWIMEVSSVYQFSRETYHSSILILDLFLSIIDKLDIDKFQLIGVCCLLISAKNEEYMIPEIKNFAEATKFSYISPQILEMERHILNSLNWRIQVLSLCFWANFLMSKWSDFLVLNKLELPDFSRTPKLFNTFFFIIDIVSYDYNELFRNVKNICCSIFYLLLSKELNSFANKPDLTQENINKAYDYYDEILRNFMKNEINIDFNQMQENFNYVSNFFTEDIFEFLNTADLNHISQIQDYDKKRRFLAEKSIANTSKAFI